ncbi:ATP-binding cassette domain-containing protein [Kiloniella laminariae]|uniref:ATP-binding cassette domain-containing protein n=1 Tax=Kiloniella laminariae TaxID=454162 RepID=A0ABT4LJ78_9PROT|nr:ATP-binding cassette domain-containing protein [Kiloniella laminariae]MCZ4281144.1 ATP-binding cassette domain-containing protein [Kiloniella laminariae]
MEPELFKYIWKHSRKDQISILVLVLVSMPFYFLSLDLPKSIINKAVSSEVFSDPSATLPFMQFELPYGEALFGHPVTLFEGFMLTQLPLLLALCLSFLSLVLINGVFKFVINTLKGRLGERMLRRLRYELTDRILRFPVLHSRKIKQAEIATMIKDEVEPLGGFIGDAFVTPVFLGGQALTAMIFIMVQSWWLGLVAMSIVLVQAFLIPRLRKRILTLGRQRQMTARALAGRVAELVEGAIEIQSHDTTNYERAEISSRLGKIFSIRYEIYQRKFFVKFLNNLLAQITPFIFYLGGGYLVITGQFEIGTLVAVLAAYKDLPPPVKDLINWDQQRNDVQIKYEQVAEQFQPHGLILSEMQQAEKERGEPLTGKVEISNLGLVDENENRLLDTINVSFGVGQNVAIVGNAGSGKEYLGLMLANLVQPSNGSIKIGGKPLVNLPSAITGRRLSYVGQDAYLFPLSVRDNLFYGLRNWMLNDNITEPLDPKEVERERAEALRTGNTILTPDGEWIDYKIAGIEDQTKLINRVVDVLQKVDLEEDVYRFGLSGTVDAEFRPEIAESILGARVALKEHLKVIGAEDLVIAFDPESYNKNATLRENLLFGTPRKSDYAGDSLLSMPILREAVQKAELREPILNMGVSIARTMVELFTGLPPTHPFFEQFSFISADDLPDFDKIVKRVDKSGLSDLTEADRQSLMYLPFDYVEARHRLGLVTEEVERKTLAARAILAEKLAAKDPDAVEFYDPDRFNSAASLQDNILFGRLAYGRAEAAETIGRVITELLDELGLRSDVIEVGLDYNVGVGGKRLSGVQRQKLAMARSLIKNPDLLILNEAAAVLDSQSQNKLIPAIIQSQGDRGLVWTLQRAELAVHFDQVFVMQNGRIVESGAYSELSTKGKVLKSLIAAE